ncbi:MAG: hypothetical protein JNN01_25415 [Opitutaceae bacterium]|nr:hypothetical protein [Opitutaceae bacterium]
MSRSFAAARLHALQVLQHFASTRHFLRSPACVPGVRRCCSWLVLSLAVAAGDLAPARAAQLVLTWQDNSNNESGFIIERAILGGLFLPIAWTGANVVTYTDANLAPDTSYSYRICAYRGLLNSSYTAVVTARTAAAAAALVPPNTAPTLSDIASRTIPAQGTTGAIPFTIGDATTSAASLIVTASSSNPTLIPSSGLILGGSGANRSITVRPSGSLSGSATITVRVSDGNLSSTDTFVVTVTPPNLPPTLSTIAARTIEWGTASPPIPFTVGDSTTAANLLAVSVSSSNPALLPSSALSLQGSGAARSLVIRPPAAVAGSATLTVAVTDGVHTTRQAFVVTIVPYNSPPQLSGLKPLTASVNGFVRKDFFAFDTETPAHLLTFSAATSNPQLLPVASLRLEGSNSSRVFSATPAPGKTGVAQVTLGVSDGKKITTAVFSITIVPENTPPVITGLQDLTSRSTSYLWQAFTGTDAESSPECLLMSTTSSNADFIPPSRIAFGSDGIDRAIVITPVYGRTGTSTISVTLSDGVLSTVRTFKVTITP